MKIVYVVDKLSVGGAEKTLLTQANMMADYGHNVHLLTYIPERSESLLPLLNQNITHHYIQRNYKYHPLTAIRIGKLLKQFDVVHVHMRQVMRYVYYIQQFVQLPNSVFFQDQFGDIDFDQTIDQFLLKGLRKCQYITVRKLLIDWAIKNELQLSNIHLLHNSVPKLPTEQRNQENLSVYKMVLVSNIRTTKNIEFALSLLAKLKEVLPCSLDIYGAVVDKEYFESLKTLAKQLQVTDCVCWIHGVNEVQPFLGQYQLALHPSYSEAYPIVLIEFIAQSLPFLVTNGGEMNDVLKKSNYPLLIPSLDLAEWKSQILHLANDAQYSNKIRLELTNLYLQQYSIESYYQKCLTIYQQNQA